MKKVKFAKYTALIAVFIYGIFGAYAAALSGLPKKLSIAPGESEKLEGRIPLPLTLQVTASRDEVLSEKGTLLSGEDGSIVIKAEDEGTAKLSFGLLGIEIKSVEVTVGRGRVLIPGGDSIGVMLYTKGALIVGAGDIEDSYGRKINPAKKAGLLSGDVIEAVDGAEVKNAEGLSALLEYRSGEEVTLLVKRDGKHLEIKATPVTDREDGKAKLGLWVRDSTAGVGTLTYYDGEKGCIGGLGHAISDADTGKMLLVGKGEVIPSRIIGVVKGEPGEPGELKGYFDPEEEVLGTVKKNTGLGLFASAEKKVESLIYPQGLPAAGRDEVHAGEASILATVDGSGVKEYSCRIIKVNSQRSPKQKSFVIKITDEKLLGITGGIVQGMSGSPVIQDGKIVGAVTHVMVSDPTCGYGIYIEWMLAEEE